MVAMRSVPIGLAANLEASEVQAARNAALAPARVRRVNTRLLRKFSQPLMTRTRTFTRHMGPLNSVRVKGRFMMNRLFAISIHFPATVGSGSAIFPRTGAVGIAKWAFRTRESPPTRPAGVSHKGPQRETVRPPEPQCPALQRPAAPDRVLDRSLIFHTVQML